MEKHNVADKNNIKDYTSLLHMCVLQDTFYLL